MCTFDTSVIIDGFVVVIIIENIYVGIWDRDVFLMNITWKEMTAALRLSSTNCSN